MRVVGVFVMARRAVGDGPGWWLKTSAREKQWVRRDWLDLLGGISLAVS